jgi:hypothetical protein
LFRARGRGREAYRISPLDHLVLCAELRAKTMWLAGMSAKNRSDAVMGVKALQLTDTSCDPEEQWANERYYTTNVVRGAKAEKAFPARTRLPSVPESSGHRVHHGPLSPPAALSDWPPGHVPAIVTQVFDRLGHGAQRGPHGL